MSISLNKSMENPERYDEKSRLDNILPQNQELINNLNLKIHRRINNGYYYQVDAKRKALPIPSRYRFQPKLKQKKVHPVFKKAKKINEKIEAVDQWQNTSGEYVLKEPDPILEDEQMQFSCQIQQRNQSMQWSIQPIPHYNQGVQYTLQSQIVLIQCRDASIQYSFQEPQPQPQINIVYENTEIQCEKIKNQQFSVQYDEPLPQTKQKDLQINLPDLKQLGVISSMQNRMKYLKNEQRKQLKLQKQKERQIQILKLKQIMQKLQGKILLANEKQQYMKKKMESQLSLKQKQRKFKLQKQKIRQQAQKHYNYRLQQTLSKLKQGYKRPQINNSYKLEQQRRLAQLQKEQKLSKEELQNYRKQVDELKKNLKEEMFKRLNYEDESDDDTATERDEKLRSSSRKFHSLRKGSNNDISMDSLFPSVKNRYAGSIIKNINSQQRKLNDHEESLKLGRSYWRSKSPFNYQYEQASAVRMNRKYSYLQKVEKKKLLDKIQSQNSDNPEIQQQTNFHPRTHFNVHQISDYIAKAKYTAKRMSFKWEELKQIKKEFDYFFKNEELFRYLYSEQDKIKLGQKLFQVMKTEIDQRLKKSIKIFKYLKYIVFQLQTDKNIQFILFNHNKSVITGLLPIQKTNYQFYQYVNLCKNGEIIQYLNQNQLFGGLYLNGQKNGYGILSNSSIYYEGDFYHGKKQGFGKLILQNGDIYKGQFKNNLFDGEGVYTWINGQNYDGYFRQGLKHGWGRQNFQNGASYVGQYKNNKRDGKGTYRWADGTTYQGKFVNDQKYGQGKLECANGTLVFAEWKQDQMIQGTSRKQIKGRSREDFPLTSKIKHNK